MTHDANDIGLGITPIARARKISEIPDPASYASLRHGRPVTVDRDAVVREREGNDG